MSPTRVEEESKRVAWHRDRRCVKCGEPPDHPKHRGITRTHTYERQGTLEVASDA